jgi:hypothetical protein
MSMINSRPRESAAQPAVFVRKTNILNHQARKTVRDSVATYWLEISGYFENCNFLTSKKIPRSAYLFSYFNLLQVIGRNGIPLALIEGKLSAIISNGGGKNEFG